MSTQEISVSNNQKKQLLKNAALQSVALQDDNGDFVVNVAAYLKLRPSLEAPIIENVIGEANLDYTAEYFIFTS